MKHISHIISVLIIALLLSLIPKSVASTFYDAYTICGDNSGETSPKNSTKG
jgi:hypothetical protein